MIRERLRQERIAQGLSLGELARAAKMSSANLSRIETGKQNLDVDTFLRLARLLRVPAADLVDEEESGGHDIAPLAERIARFDIATRLRLWRDVAARQHQKRAASRKLDNAAIAAQVEELLTQIDAIRDELSTIQKRLRGR